MDGHVETIQNTIFIAKLYQLIIIKSIDSGSQMTDTVFKHAHNVPHGNRTKMNRFRRHVAPFSCTKRCRETIEKLNLEGKKRENAEKTKNKKWLCVYGNKEREAKRKKQKTRRIIEDWTTV